MTKTDFLLLLEKLLELEYGSLNGNESLQDLAAWDSLSILGFIAAVDKELKVVLSPVDINKANTINDLINLLGDKIQQ